MTETYGWWIDRTKPFTEMQKDILRTLVKLKQATSVQLFNECDSPAKQWLFGSDLMRLRDNGIIAQSKYTGPWGDATIPFILTDEYIDIDELFEDTYPA